MNFVGRSILLPIIDTTFTPTFAEMTIHAFVRDMANLPEHLKYKYLCSIYLNGYLYWYPCEDVADHNQALELAIATLPAEEIGVAESCVVGFCEDPDCPCVGEVLDRTWLMFVCRDQRA